jgi:hypothetical protein
MLYRVKSLNGISKQTLKLVPLSGQTQVTNGGKIIVALPASSLVDLSTFELNLKGYTQHGGKYNMGDHCGNCYQYFKFC